MSLILEALKKLDREKQAPERGVVVVGATSWASRERPRAALVGGLLAVAVGVVVTMAVAPRRHGVPERPTEPAAATPARVAESSPTRAGAGPAAPLTKPAAHAATPMPSPGVPPDPMGAPPTTLGRATAVGPGDDSRPTPTPSAEPAAYRLVAISRRDGHPVAILNDRLVREGDSFDGITVVRIGDTEVEIEVNGKRTVVGF